MRQIGKTVYENHKTFTITETLAAALLRQDGEEEIEWVSEGWESKGETARVAGTSRHTTNL